MNAVLGRPAEVVIGAFLLGSVWLADGP